jgi:2-dehydropantoate 2-reductase
MQNHARCWIVGAGAVGSVLAALLHQNQTVEACLVGSSVHAEEIQKKGLLFQIADHKPSAVHIKVCAPDQVPALVEKDLVLMTGKVPLLDRTLRWLRPKCGPEVGIIALQNGIGPEEIISQGLSRPVDRGLLFFGANSRSPGTVRYFPGAIHLKPSAVTENLCHLLAGSTVKCEMAENFREMEWFKLAINCVANPFAGILKAGNRQIAQDVLNPAKELVLSEVCRVAEAEGVSMAVTVEEMNRYLQHDNVPSLKTDLDRGMPTEIEVLNGAVVRLAKRHGISTPANRLIVSMVKYLES